MQRNTEEGGRPAQNRERPRRDRWNEASARIPAIAVVVVAVTAVVTAVMVTQADRQRAERAAGVMEGEPDAAMREQRAGPACRDCGVVESVVALERPAQASTTAYQMHIRMDDGSLRTVEQRGALAAGSRVVVAGGAARPVRSPG